MPYKNIVFIKLFLSLFEEDDRFLFQLNESQQILFIKMLYMAAITDNCITKNPRFICSKINYHHEEECFLRDIDRIKEVFSGFTEDANGYHFSNFHELHNYMGKPTSKSRDFPDKDKEKIKIKRRIRKEEDKERFISPSKEFKELVNTLSKEKSI